jgi:hypothetical protein
MIDIGLRYRLRSECEAGFGTRTEWAKGHFTDVCEAKKVRDKLDARGGRSTNIIVLFPGDWYYDGRT